MSRRWRGWIPTIIFWGLFLASLALGKRYRWLDTVWYGAGLLLLLALSVYSVVHVVRHRHITDGISYKGIPRWLERFAEGEDSNQTDSASKIDPRHRGT